jgi:hypothetical protein
MGHHSDPTDNTTGTMNTNNTENTTSKSSAITIEVEQLKHFLGQLIRVQLCHADGKNNNTLVGKLLSVTDNALVLEHKDLRRTIIRLDEVATASQLPRRRSL